MIKLFSITEIFFLFTPFWIPNTWIPPLSPNRAHIVASNIFDAKRNRPAEFAREKPQVAPPVTLDVLKQFAASQGRAFEATTPEEVAEHIYQGVVRGDYFILPSTPESEARMRERFEGVLGKRNPPLAF